MSIADPTPPGDDAAGTAARRARQAARRGRAVAESAPTTGGSTDRSPSAPDASAPAATLAPGRRELDPDTLAALEEERTFLLRSLDDLEREHDAGDVDDSDYLGLKDDYTARAAAVIRSIEQRQAAFQQARPPRNRGRVLAWIAVLLVVSVGLGVIVARSSGRRDPGDSVSGDIRQTVRDQLLDARASFGQRQFVEAIATYDSVLEAEPANTEALTYKGWLLYLTSRQTSDAADTQILVARAKELLDTAVEIDPTYGDARVFRANVWGALDRPADGLADLDAVQPGSIPAEMAGTVDMLRARLEAAVAGTGTAVPASSG